MSFPISLKSNINIDGHQLTHDIILNRSFTVILGPNGSGKTHLLRGMKSELATHTDGKYVRFISAGRMGVLEQYRADHDGYRGGNPAYDGAVYGTMNDTERRHRMESIIGDFQTIAVRADIQIKIQERLRKLFKRNLTIEWNGGNLKASFSTLSVNPTTYSSGREASGLMHLVGILAALYDDEVGALLLDEPEVSMHPQLQAFLLREIVSVSGYPSNGNNKKIVIIATHSTEMLKIQEPDDLLSLVFCNDLMTHPLQIPADSGELKNNKIKNLVARLGQEHKLCLFASRPLLVEGPSDVMICSALANKLDIHLEAAGSQLLPVIGKEQMPIVAKLLRLIGKSPVALADADAIADGLDLINSFLDSNNQAESLATSLGFSSARMMSANIFQDFCLKVDRHWDQISELAKKHPYWVNKKNDEENKAKRRSSFSTLFTTDNETLSSLAKDNSWVLIKNRLVALLDLLEKNGLFILRRGSIESYYQHADIFSSVGKPGAAVSEIDFINNSPSEDISFFYNDIIRCINTASNTEVISEADALKNTLISVVAPSLARLRSGERINDYNLLAQEILGERAKIFDITKDGDSLIVSIKSSILNISGFPLKIRENDDVVKLINAVLSNQN